MTTPRPDDRHDGDPVPHPATCRGCGNVDPDGRWHLIGERKCCPDCDHRAPPTEVELAEPEVLVGELLDPVDPHGVKATDRGAIVELTCRCGQWEAAAGGPASLAWAARDHRRHVREVLADEARARG